MACPATLQLSMTLNDANHGAALLSQKGPSEAGCGSMLAKTWCTLFQVASRAFLGSSRAGIIPAPAPCTPTCPRAGSKEVAQCILGDMTMIKVDTKKWFLCSTGLDPWKRKQEEVGEAEADGSHPIRLLCGCLDATPHSRSRGRQSHSPAGTFPLTGS